MIAEALHGKVHTWHVTTVTTLHVRVNDCRIASPFTNIPARKYRAAQCKNVSFTMENYRIQIILCIGHFCYSTDDLDSGVVKPA